MIIEYTQTGEVTLNNGETEIVMLNPTGRLKGYYTNIESEELHLDVDVYDDLNSVSMRYELTWDEVFSASLPVMIGEIVRLAVEYPEFVGLLPKQ